MYLLLISRFVAVLLPLFLNHADEVRWVEIRLGGKKWCHILLLSQWVNELAIFDELFVQGHGITGKREGTHQLIEGTWPGGYQLLIWWWKVMSQSSLCAQKAMNLSMRSNFFSLSIWQSRNRQSLMKCWTIQYQHCFLPFQLTILTIFAEGILIIIHGILGGFLHVKTCLGCAILTWQHVGPAWLWCVGLQQSPWCTLYLASGP